MGLKHVNTYLKETCSSKAITTIHLEMLSGKRLVIDTSIYIYKFMVDNELFENMYIFISLFLKYNITPIFVFDGRPPKQKEECIAGRLDEKYKAITKINELQEELLHSDSKERISKELEHYKKKSLIIKDKHIKEIKAMMDAFNVSYITAEEEADPICAYLTKSGQVWGCLSDDMDMFVYGCPRVLRLLNLKKETVIYYNTQQITREINVGDMFPNILLLLGTDYQTKDSGITMHKALMWYFTFSCSNPQEEFYSWLMTKGYLNKQQKQELEKVLEMFHTPSHILLIEQNKKPVQWDVLQTILAKYGFLFLQN